jgi:hypothetical protein
LGPISLVEKGKLERHASRAAGQNCAGIARDVVDSQGLAQGAAQWSRG